MRLTWRRQPLRLRHRFATSRGGIDEKQTLVVELEHDGIVGLGEAAPSLLYGQTLESTEAALARAERLLGDDPLRIHEIVARLAVELDDQRAAMAAVDSCLHDWAARRLGVPLWQLLGLPRPAVRTTFTIGAAPPDEIRRKLDLALDAGYDVLKVKVGVEDDLRALTTIRERFAGPLLLDANEAWTPDVAAVRVRELARFEPAMIEQPLPRQHWRGMRELRELGVAPIFADEDAQRPADVVRLAGFVDGVNVKFTKCGGVREGLNMITLARGLGLRVMIGCMISSSLAIAPALAIAGLCDWADLDGALLLEDDPFIGIDVRGSEMSLGSSPGLGVSARPTGGA
jgi:L-Ala-D/L-Glu epimerase